jgi:ornithine cyclodeaminase
MKTRTTPVHTDFLGATQAARLVAQVGVAACLAGLADAIEQDFARWPDFEKSARLAHHSPGGVIELMPVSDAPDYAFKYVNGHPDNADRDLPTVMAFGALADVATGLPVFLSELTLATALRTAATSALAARRLARPGSRSMALIGAGSQSEFQALAFTHLLGVSGCASSTSTSRPCASWWTTWAMQALPPSASPAAPAAPRRGRRRHRHHGHGRQAPRLRDRRCRCAPRHAHQCRRRRLPRQDRAARGVAARARVFVEFTPRRASKASCSSCPPTRRDRAVAACINGLAPGRGHDTEITLFDSVGFALEDYSALRWLRALAHDTGLMQSIDLVPRWPTPATCTGWCARPGRQNAALADTGTAYHGSHEHEHPYAPQTARALRLIGVPTDIGASRLGAPWAPTLRVAGSAPALRASWAARCATSATWPAAQPRHRRAGLRHLAPACAWMRPCTRPWARRWTMASCR